MSKKVRGMSLWDHLIEFFTRLRRILYAFIISTIAVMVVPIDINFTNISLSDPFYQTIASIMIRNLQERFLTETVVLVPLDFFAPLEVYVFISIVIGTTISLPVMSYELYKFFNPAIYKHEKRFALKFIAAFIGLFVLGFVLGYLYVVPLTFQMMIGFSSLLKLPLIYNFSEFFSMVGMILLICGLLFTFPIYIYILIRVGILRTQQLTKNRKYLYGAILIAISILDPDPGLVTESITFIPIVVLMEITIFISKRIEKANRLQLDNQSP